ncbi:hypothetical protein KKD57_04825 [Patescibacteria group bacterium]|nr:hypothetical protein [Patescibacteria group bacterium]
MDRNETKLEENLWIAGGYYVDFDEIGQFRIIGPNNHLYCGLIDIPTHKIKINSVAEKDNVLYVKGFFAASAINLYYPAMDDIRTMRMLKKEGKDRTKTFLEIRREFERSIPQIIKLKEEKSGSSISFKRFYDEDFYYESIFEFNKDVKIKKIVKPYKGFEIFGKEKKINFLIKASTNDINCKKFSNFFDAQEGGMDFGAFGKKKDLIKKIWNRAEKEIKHLIAWGKTSGDRFGTIFPRDWMESADLGAHDLNEAVRGYMYEASLKNVNKKGEGWHEDVVGEFKYEFEISGKDILDRHMIDIEPHYILGMKFLSNDFFLNKEIREKVKLVARYIANNAREKDYIIFKEMPLKMQKPGGKYHRSGNWRDGAWSFKKIADGIAPFDVNAVFYPEALKVLKEFQEKLGIRIPDIDKLISKWQNKKQEYLFKNSDGKIAYALALFNPDPANKKSPWKKMEVNHLDESYLYTYSAAAKEEIESFCDRLLDKKYFYTASGPLLIANNNQYGYTTAEYHGMVIWVKQTAFTVLALSRALKQAIIEEWDKELTKKIKKTMIVTAENSFNAFESMGSIPELYWDDNGKARLFSNQPNVQASLSKVQLWSAVGARRIIRKYYQLLTDERYIRY